MLPTNSKNVGEDENRGPLCRACPAPARFNSPTVLFNLINRTKIVSDNKPTAPYSVAAKADYFRDFVRVFIPIYPYIKDSKPRKLNSRKNYINEGISAKEFKMLDFMRSIRRTRKVIKDICLCNDFDYFVTFTFDRKKGDRYDHALCKKKMRNWLRNERRRKGNFEYIIVPELHKDNALHFHALLSGYKGEVRQSYWPNGSPKIIKGKKAFHLPSYTHGWSDLKIIDKNLGITRVAYYIQKYISKALPAAFGKNRYWRSKGLLLPVTEENPETWYQAFKPDREYEINRNDAGEVQTIGKMVEFDKGSNPVVDMFIEAHQP